MSERNCSFEYTIRPVTADDVCAMAEIERLSFPRPWSAEQFIEELTRNDLARYVGAEADGKLIAYAGIWLVSGEGYVTQIAVHPDYRRQGVGRAVVRAMIDAAEENGAWCQTLEVRRSNDAAISLYEKLGFREAGVRKNFYEDNGEDALILWRGKMHG